MQKLFSNKKGVLNVITGADGVYTAKFQLSHRGDYSGCPDHTRFTYAKLGIKVAAQIVANLASSMPAVTGAARISPCDLTL